MTRPGRARALLFVAACLGGCIDYFPELPPRPEAIGDAAPPDAAPCAPAPEICNGVDDDCDGATDELLVACAAESCMICHNGARAGDDYSGDGLINPHAFPGADAIRCTGCHGGDADGDDAAGSHVPPPPEIGDRAQRAADPEAHFNRLTLTGLDRRGGELYEVGGHRFSRLDYIQFVNPGDLRVVAAGRGCGQQACHAGAHAEWVPRAMHATATGIVGGIRVAVGLDAPGAGGRDFTAAHTAPRAVAGLEPQPEPAAVGGALAGVGAELAPRIGDHVDSSELGRPNRVATGSPLADVVDGAVNARCGSCHLWSAGENDRAGRYRTSGCPACHMEYANDGRYRGTDDNIRRDEPADPDALRPGERPHVLTHQIRNVAKVLPDGTFVRGISDRACLACHRDSNRTVLQYWGLRVDDGGDLAAARQYPADPGRFEAVDLDRAAVDVPGFDLAQRGTSDTFDGRPLDRYIEIEDYDGDGRDDTPPDIHAEVGMACIDCHGSRDVHGGTEGDPSSGEITHRQEESTHIRCVSCHGSVDAFAATAPCETYTGERAECGLDAQGNPLRHVTKDAAGHYWLVSRVGGARHYLVQTRDVTVDSGRLHPVSGAPLFAPLASYAMGRADGSAQTGTGPLQGDANLHAPTFSHMEVLDCAACHAAWTDSCIGCHLTARFEPEAGHFSRITGEPSLLAADGEAIYRSPVLAYLGVGPRGLVSRFSPAEKVFWRYADGRGRTSAALAFGDRAGEGNNPGRDGRGDLPALSADAMAPHSIRGAVTRDREGPLYCVACHINADMVADAEGMAAYTRFAAAYDGGDFAAIDFDALRREIGQNPGNQRNSPFYVRMILGLGTGLFLFDADGCPINPLDRRAGRGACAEAPAEVFAGRIERAAFDLDRIVQFGGVANVSSGHRQLAPAGVQREGALNRGMAGPLGSRIIRKLIGGDDIGRALVLDAWLDADGRPRGLAGPVVER